MTIAVADATVLIYLSKLGELTLLEERFDDVLVPAEVYTEVVGRGRAEGYHDAIGIEEATGSVLSVVDLDESDSRRAAQLRDCTGLGRGETAAISLARAVGARCLTDDHAARTTATSIGVDVGGTLYVLLSGLETGEYSLEGCVSRLDALTERGYRIDAALYRDAVEAGREIADDRT